MSSGKTGRRLLAALCAISALIACITDGPASKQTKTSPRIWKDSTFYASGKLETVWTMKDSLRHGYFFTVYETGERMKQGRYLEGEKRGWFFYWWENGQLNQEWYIKQGEILAICVKIWDENGVPSREDSCDAQNYLDTTYKQLTGL